MGKALIGWSGGKDSAWTLQRLRDAPGAEVAGLFTTVEEDTGRVAAHAVPGSLLEAQARAAGLPLHRVAIPRPCPNVVYEAAVAKFVEGFDDDFLKQLPDTVDPCGERGEFHTFAFAGPMFRAPLSACIGAVTERDGFAYADVASI